MRKAKVEIKKEKRFLRCTLTREELLAAGKMQADKHGEYLRTEADKKRVMTDFTAKLAALEAELCSLSGKISSGYEFRDVTCTVRMGDPTPEKKTILRDDTMEEVGIEDLTREEMQRELINTDDTMEEVGIEDLTREEMQRELINTDDAISD